MFCGPFLLKKRQMVTPMNKAICPKAEWERKVRKGVRLGEQKRLMKAVVFLLPSLAMFSVFVIYPFFKTILQSLFLTNNRGMLTQFAGTANYADLFSDPVYLQSMGATLLYTVICVPLTVGISLFLALLTNRKSRGMGIYRTVFSSTMGVSVAAGSVFWSLLFHPTVGVLNKVIRTLGGSPIGWLTDPKFALLSVALASVWMNIGFSYLVLTGGLKNIDSCYYECTDLVGGGFLFKLRKVILPLLSPSLFFVLVISVINSFQSFGVIDMLTQGGPMNRTKLLVYGLYQEAFVNFQYGKAAAQGVVLFLLVFLVSMAQIKLTERWVTYQ